MFLSPYFFEKFGCPQEAIDTNLVYFLNARKAGDDYIMKLKCLVQICLFWCDNSEADDNESVSFAIYVVSLLHTSAKTGSTDKAVRVQRKCKIFTNMCKR